ncbi:hypothetical protein ACJ72_00451 [Emergomyces africanus]|uniref:Uncharacterized protein n=1 Tax=Emergomyces africanus TaxID=1955775 RepID=A0A1B7P829_9EURO|nr:hypothetical protein ACJ72_00451 [Emergomyces africanus]
MFFRSRDREPEWPPDNTIDLEDCTDDIQPLSENQGGDVQLALVTPNYAIIAHLGASDMRPMDDLLYP